MWAGVVFNSLAPNWDYTIRLNYTDVPDTSIAVNTLRVCVRSAVLRCLTTRSTLM